MTELRTPAVIVNFKAYSEVEGKGALRLAKICDGVARSTGVNIVVCPPTAELTSVARGVSIPVMAQHVDARKAGAATGWVTATAIKATGAVGSLVNHSEHRLARVEIAAVVEACRDVGLISCVCADSAETAADLATIGPDLIAVEPPELIGGDVSVTSAKPEVVEKTVMAVRAVDGRIPVLCGAGVKNGNDVARALELGTKGVLLASGVVRAKDPKSVLLDLVKSIREG